MAKCIVRLGDGYASESSTLCEWLRGDVVFKCRIANTLDKAIAQGAGYDAECFYGLRSGDVLHNIGICSPSMNQLPAGCIDEGAVSDVTSPEFHLLAKCA